MPRLLVLFAALAATSAAQDTFEIQVYQYITVPKGMWNLETHANYVGKGSRTFDGTVAPTNNQFHLTYELTHGITDHFELAGYLVLARRVNGSLDYAGWRVRPRFRLPETWLPFKFSLSTEVGFPTKAYDSNSATLEIRPVIEKSWGKLTVDLNPVVGRALRGPEASEGWDFEPSTRIGYTLHPRFDATVEYYGSVGALTGFNPTDEQVHLIFPGGDFRITPNVVWNFGVGWAATPAGNQLTYKMRIGWMFGRKNNNN